MEDNRYPTDSSGGELVSNTNRRRVLKGLAGAGAGTVAASQLFAERAQATASDRVSIVVGYRSADPDNPAESLAPVEKDVPADWYEDLQRARRVNERIISRYGSRDGVVGVGVEPGEYGGQNAAVTVDLRPDQANELRGIIPERVDDVPVETAIESGITADGHSPCDDGNSNCNDSDFGYSIPGGVQCKGDTYGTTMSRMYDEDGNRRFATAGHLYDAKDASGEKLYHPDDDEASVGVVVRSHCYDDFVLASEENWHYPQRRIEDADPESVNGQFSKDGVADLKAAGEYIRKVGQTSCMTCGLIESADYTHWGYGCTPKDGQVKWGEETDSQGGDSGAPVYHLSPEDSSYQWIVSFDLWSGCCSAGGTSAWSIKNTHDYHF